MRKLNAIIPEKVIAKVLESVQHLLAGWDDVLFGEEESVAARVPQLDLVAILGFKFI